MPIDTAYWYVVSLDCGVEAMLPKILPVRVGHVFWGSVTEHQPFCEAWARHALQHRGGGDSRGWGARSRPKEEGRVMSLIILPNLREIPTQDCVQSLMLDV